MTHATIASPVTIGALTPVSYRGQAVITTAALAAAYETAAIQIRQNYSNNSHRFIEGKHLFKVTGRDLEDLRVAFSDSQISPKARSLILWTKRGAARHAKMLNTDRAWEVFEELERYGSIHVARELIEHGKGGRPGLAHNPDITAETLTAARGRRTVLDEAENLITAVNRHDSAAIGMPGFHSGVIIPGLCPGCSPMAGVRRDKARKRSNKPACPVTGFRPPPPGWVRKALPAVLVNARSQEGLR